MLGDRKQPDYIWVCLRMGYWPPSSGKFPEKKYGTIKNRRFRGTLSSENPYPFGVSVFSLFWGGHKQIEVVRTMSLVEDGRE